MLAFSAGIIFFACGFTIFNILPKGTIIDGIDVSYKTKPNAIKIIRTKIQNEVKEKELKIIGEKQTYIFTYPEITFKDNTTTLINSIKSKGEYTTKINYYLNGINEVVNYISSCESTPTQEPHAIFNLEGEPFTYVDGINGEEVDQNKLKVDILTSLSNKFEQIEIYTHQNQFKKTIQDIKKETEQLSFFITYFDQTKVDRVHNISLAAQKINGSILYEGEEFSFNQTVGERTEENGFKSAKIIERGEFIEGIGGGVCQVSTTLYNAVLRAGLKIKEVHPHSLAVSYVPPSFDAMVSGNYFDLKFQNTTSTPIYIRAIASNNYIKFAIYGKSIDRTYEFLSKIVESIPAPIEQTTNPEQVKEGRDGIISEGYMIETYEDTQKTILFRHDRYYPQKHIVLFTPPILNSITDILFYI